MKDSINKFFYLGIASITAFMITTNSVLAKITPGTVSNSGIITS